MSDEILKALRAYTAKKVEAADEITRLRAELAAERDAAIEKADLTWFWQIVDCDGLNNVCSDERGALRELVRAAAERDALRAALQYARNLIGPDEVIDAALKGDWDE